MDNDWRTQGHGPCLCTGQHEIRRGKKFCERSPYQAIIETMPRLPDKASAEEARAAAGFSELQWRSFIV